MIALPTNSLPLYVAGLADCKITDPQDLLRELRSRRPSLQLQLIRADRVAGAEHLQFAARNALLAYSSSRKRAKSLAVEFLLYVSCTRQISKAIERLGVTEKTRKVVLAVFAETENDVDGLVKEVIRVTGGRPMDSILELSEKKIDGLMKVYGVTEIEIDATRVAEESKGDVLKRLVIERSALVAVDT